MRIFPEKSNTLTDLQLSLRIYFPEFSVNHYKWVIHPFGGKNETINLPNEEN